MYLDHFRLTDTPFSLTPDTGYYYNYTSCQEAFNVVLVALESGEGIVKIVGEVGTGKTLMCRKLLNDLPADTVSVYLPNPLMEPQQLYRAVAEELDIEVENDSAVTDLLDRLYRRLIHLHDAGQRVVVCVDEAQTMPTQTLEALRLLSNVETEKSKLLQLVLFAQPELDERLAHRSLRQLRQRIGFSYRLKAFDFHGFSGYLEHRLHMAGYRGAPLFSRRAQRLLFRATSGIPRLINILAHKAMLASYGRGELQIGVRQIRAAIADTEGLSTRSWRSLMFWTLMVSGLCAVSFVVGLQLNGWLR